MNFKKHLVYLSAITFLAACTNSNKSGDFELTGTLTDGGVGMNIYLDNLTTNGIVHLDSTKIMAGGKFAFHTNGIYKGFYNLRISEGDYATLILDSNEHANVDGSSQFLGNTYMVTGSEDSKLFCEVNNVMKKTEMAVDSMKRLTDAFINTVGSNKAKMDSLQSAMEKFYSDKMLTQRNYISDFIKKHPSSFASLAFIQILPYEENESTYTMVDEALTKAYPKSKYTIMFHSDVENSKAEAQAKIESAKKTAIGMPAPDFTLPDTNGKDIALSSFKGKVVLVDFWASWCQPCRESMPGLIRVYDKYKNKNFTILGVSLDKDMDHWVKGIKDLGLTWTHVSELKYWDSKVVKQYGFDGIPFNVLVSEDGTILAKGLDESTLYQKLAGVLKGK
jgi:peroxiredoxin